MILAIDAGNTRAKWGLADLAPDAVPQWRATGAVALSDIEKLPDAWRSLPAPERIAVANVAGDAVRERLSRALSQFGVTPQWIRAAAAACGVKNLYDDPAQLGCDRWAALVAAWNRVRGACLVVNAGTATTVDMLSAAGEFRGGVILPGVALMKKSLAENTAGLDLHEGSRRAEPRNTADAIETGCHEAQIGAIGRMYAHLSAGAACLVSGGGAAAIAASLSFATVVEHLTLEGIARLAAARATQEIDA